jgi:hypothetical protein
LEEFQFAPVVIPSLFSVLKAIYRLINVSELQFHPRFLVLGMNIRLFVSEAIPGPFSLLPISSSSNLLGEELNIFYGPDIITNIVIEYVSLMIKRYKIILQ